MGTHESKTTEGHAQLARDILKKLREKRKDQWIYINQIIAEPQIFDPFGHIARDEIDDAISYIIRENVPREPKIETNLNENTSVVYIKSNSENCKREGHGPRPRRNRENCDGDHRTDREPEITGKEGLGADTCI